MVVRFIQYIFGYLRLEVKGVSPERFFNMCAHHNMKIWRLDTKGDIYRFYISRLNFRKLRDFSRKTGTKIHIIERHGLPFIIHKHRKKKLLFFFIILCMVLACASRNYIWNIEIDGNQYYTSEDIISYLNENDVQRYMNCKNIDFDKIESLIREKYYFIIWVSVSLDKTNLVINVKENEKITLESVGESDTIEASVVNVTEMENQSYGTDIVASTSGYIASIITRSGRALVHVGDYVEEGDVLVTGCLEIMGDYDVLMGYTYVDSDADIQIETTYTYQNLMSLYYQKKVYTDNSQKNIYVKFASYYFMLNQKEIIEYYYDVSAIELTLAPEQQTNFQFSVGVITSNAYVFEEDIYTENEIQKILSENFQVYQEELVQKGVEIIENNVRIYIDETFAIAKGDIQVFVSNYEKVDTEIKVLPEDVIQEGTDE